MDRQILLSCLQQAFITTQRPSQYTPSFLHSLFSAQLLGWEMDERREILAVIVTGQYFLHSWLKWHQACFVAPAFNT